MKKGKQGRNIVSNYFNPIFKVQSSDYQINTCLLGSYLTELQIRHLLFKIMFKQLWCRIRDKKAQDNLYINYDQNLVIIWGIQKCERAEDSLRSSSSCSLS